MANRKNLIIVAGNPMWIGSGAPTGWGVWLAALVVTVGGIGGFMALCTWLIG